MRCAQEEVTWPARPKSSEGPEDELDFPAYQEFIEFLIERLGYLPYVEREKQVGRLVPGCSEVTRRDRSWSSTWRV